MISHKCVGWQKMAGVSPKKLIAFRRALASRVDLATREPVDPTYESQGGPWDHRSFDHGRIWDSAFANAQTVARAPAAALAGKAQPLMAKPSPHRQDPREMSAPLALKSPEVHVTWHGTKMLRQKLL